MSYRHLIVNEAKSWIGTPYKHYTSKKGIGTDCGLFVMQVFANLKLVKYEKPDFYPMDWAMHNPKGHLFELWAKKYCDEIPKEKLSIGDVIFYYFGKCVSHSAILIHGNMIIHSQRPIGVVVSNRETCKWAKRERKYFTLKRKN